MRLQSPADETAGNSEPVETEEPGKIRYIFRGDDYYRGGPVGRPLGAEADAADIQDMAEHVLRKESRRTSRYTSFTRETKIARKFTSFPDNRHVRKVEMVVLRDLAIRGIIRIWQPDQVHAALRQNSGKLAKQAADVRAAMQKNREILIEGQIPEGVLQPAN
jgi:hypothetical protein